MDIKKLFPNASRDTIAVNRQLSRAKPEQDKEKSLGCTVQGKTEGVRRIRVLFTQCRVRLLDDDATGNPCKDLLDGLRYAGLIPEDNPAQIAFTTQQEKVAHRSEEATIIEIEY